MSVQAAKKEEKPKDEPKKEAAGKKPKADDKKAKPEKEESRKGESSPDGTKALPKLSLPLPEGQDSIGVVIPYTDAAMKKTMDFRIGVATRVDENHLRMTNLLIETYNDETGAKEMTIDLPKSVLDLNTRVITGNERVTIKRSDFEITGTNMEFNTETKQGRVDGNVKMIIYDLSDESGSTSKPEAKHGE